MKLTKLEKYIFVKFPVTGYKISLKNFDFLLLSPLILGLSISFFIVPNEIIKSFKKNENSVKVFFSGLIFGSIPSVWLHLN